MERPIEWQDLVPFEPEWSSLKDLDCPNPHDFFERAFLDLCGVDVQSGRKMVRQEIPPHSQRVFGVQGTAEIGFRWVEEKDRESSRIPLYAKTRTHGLPGMTIYWEYRWEYAGEAGHAAFRHGSLKACFENREAHRRFVALWRVVFGKTPIFAAAVEPPPDLPMAPSGK